jgi:DNA repair protein RadC
MDPIFLLSPFRTLLRRVRLGGSAPAGQPEAEAPLALPRRIDRPAAASQLAGDLLRYRREDVTLTVYLDERHRLVGTAILAVGWVQTARLSARPVLAGALACRAASCVLVRYGRCCGRSATEQEQASFDALAAACSRSGLVVADHLVVIG